MSSETERERETYSDRRLPHKPNPGQTHFEGCWQQPGHHNCTVVKAQNLAAERDRLVESAGGCWSPKLGSPIWGAPVTTARPDGISATPWSTQPGDRI